MLEMELLTPLTQFGTAGLIAWMWVTERRQAAARDRALSEAHEVIMEQRVQLEQLLTTVSANTRAITAMEAAQRRVIELIDRVIAERPRPGEGSGP